MVGLFLCQLQNYYAHFKVSAFIYRLKNVLYLKRVFLQLCVIDLYLYS